MNVARGWSCAPHKRLVRRDAHHNRNCIPFLYAQRHLGRDLINTSHSGFGLHRFDLSMDTTDRHHRRTIQSWNARGPNYDSIARFRRLPQRPIVAAGRQKSCSCQSDQALTGTAAVHGVKSRRRPVHGRRHRIGNSGIALRGHHQRRPWSRARTHKVDPRRGGVHHRNVLAVHFHPRSA